jgi:hypothetical protein
MSTSETFRATPGIYAMWVGLFAIPVLIVGFDFLKFGWPGAIERNLHEALIASLIPPLSAALWLFCFKLSFDPINVTYRSLGTRTLTLPLSEIAGVTPSRVAPISRAPLGAYVSLRDGTRILVNLKVFPDRAATRLLALAIV